MKETQETKRKNGLTVLIVIVLIITIVASSIGLYAWARYASSKAGDATAQVAKWHFELVGGNTESVGNIDFPITRTDKNTTVAKDKLAPGTFGKFEVIIDSKGTEVAYRYDITITVENCPTNLLFYTDAEHKEENKIKDERTGGTNEEGTDTETPKVATFTLSKYVPVQDANNMFSEKIYWDWPYETIGENESSDKNDEIDTDDQGKDIKMSITVTGTEVLDNNANLANGTIRQKTLADLVEEEKIKIADYVNYDPTKGIDNNEEVTCTVTKEDTGDSTSNTFTATNKQNDTTIKWRVLNINDDGTIDIIADTDIGDNDNKVLYLYRRCENAFVNAKNILNKICSIYGHGYGAQSARSIRIGDIDQFTDFDPTTDYTCGDSSTGYCGGTNTAEFKNQKLFEELYNEETNEVIGCSGTAVSKTGVGLMHQTYYEYSNNQIRDTNGTSSKDIKNMIFGTGRHYWIASRCADISSWNCSFCVRCTDGDRLGNEVVYNSADYYTTYGVHGYAICPVVTLKSDIILEKEEGSNTWNIK